MATYVLVVEPRAGRRDAEQQRKRSDNRRARERLRAAELIAEDPPPLRVEA